MAGKDDLVHVEIFGQDYAVRGGDDPRYVEKLASFVDEQMKEISRTSGAVDSLRIAVLAALNIADEYFRCRDSTSDESVRLRERAAHLERLVDGALAEE